MAAPQPRKEQLFSLKGNGLYHHETNELIHEAAHPPLRRKDFEAIPGWETMTPKNAYLAWLRLHPEVNVKEEDIEIVILQPATDADTKRIGKQDEDP